MLIRKATFGDYEIFFKLFCEVQNLHHDFYPKLFKISSKKYMSKKVFKQYIEDRNNSVLIAYSNNNPIGYIYITIKPKISSPIYCRPTIIYINQICVAKQFRNKGVAKKLIDQIVKLANSKSIHKIQLDVWGMNDDAQNSFKKMGFEVFNIKMELSI